MSPRKKRLVFVALGMTAVTVAIALVLNALNSNVMFFYSPSQVHAGEAPTRGVFRLGGLVQAGSLHRGADGLAVRFVVTDGPYSIAVHYRGLLPDLFREGKGVVVAGRLHEGKDFAATEVLAKHDENYMPPEAAAALKQAHDVKGARTP